jgi:hypothetical protein
VLAAGLGVERQVGVAVVLLLLELLVYAVSIAQQCVLQGNLHVTFGTSWWTVRLNLHYSPLLYNKNYVFI